MAKTVCEHFCLSDTLFSLITCTDEREVSSVSTRCPEQCASIFDFRYNKFFFSISISGDRTGEREVSTVVTWFSKKYASIYVLLVIKFFLRYLAKVKERCQRCELGAHKSLRAFSFCSAKILF